MHNTLGKCKVFAGERFMKIKCILSISNYMMGYDMHVTLWRKLLLSLLMHAWLMCNNIILAGVTVCSCHAHTMCS